MIEIVALEARQVPAAGPKFQRPQVIAAKLLIYIIHVFRTRSSPTSKEFDGSIKIRTNNKITAINVPYQYLSVF